LSNNPIPLVDEILEKQRRFELELINMSESINNNLYHLKKSIEGYEEHLNNRTYLRASGNQPHCIDSAESYDILAGMVKTEISRKLASLEAEIKTRTDFARQAQRSLPGSNFSPFVSLNTRQS